ncbi:MAG: alpha-amylase family glycosyl hydrolase, partial [Eubacteriales bacterium]
GKLSAAGFAANLRALLSNYPPPCINSLMNFLSTHDTPRITSILGGMPEDISRARAQDFSLSPGERKLALRRHALAAALLFTLPGIPCIYYGDELGLEGGPDPLNRRTFPAEGFDSEQPLHRLYSELAALRKNPALARGETIVSSRGSTLFLERAFKNERAELTLDTQILEAKLALGEKELFIP